MSFTIEPGHSDYEALVASTLRNKGETIEYAGAQWRVVKDNDIIKFVLIGPQSSFDRAYGGQSWPAGDRSVDVGPFD